MSSYTVATVSCSCKGGQAADFQDKRYGPGNRLANLVEKPKGGIPKGSAVVRCTICTKEQTISEGRLR